MLASAKPVLEGLLPAKVFKSHASSKAARVLHDPFINKGTAFSAEERAELGLNGILPPAVDTLEEQGERIYSQLQRVDGALNKNTLLTGLKERNVTLFYHVMSKHLKELFPVIYTPTEGDAIINFSRLFRRGDGCFLNIDDPDDMGPALKRFGTADDIDLIVCSDGEQILGIGDQGVGSILISSAKLAIYTACAGVDPRRVIAVGLDTGTNNQDLAKDELYLGLRHERIRGERYDNFIDKFIYECRTQYPKAMIHFEDFGLHNARRLLDKYTPSMACFNDDVQGTGCVTLAAIYAGLHVSKLHFKDVRIVLFGAGSAGIGIADQICNAIAVDCKITDEEARSKIWCVDKQGLVLQSQKDLTSGQTKYARADADAQEFAGTGLLDVIRSVKPQILIGTSTSPGAFTEEVVTEMAKHADRPIIFPLSNPTRLAEAVPEDLMKWTKGKALISTGSPFPPVKMPNGTEVEIAECNNSTTFPGIGLGVILSRARLLPPSLLVEAVKALAALGPALKDDTAALLPDVTHARSISVKIASAVIRQAQKEGLALETDIPKEGLEEWVEARMWQPMYPSMDEIRGALA